MKCPRFWPATLALDCADATDVELQLLLPNGHYGTCDQGGEDRASAHNIFVDIPPIMRSMFHFTYDPLLTHLEDDIVRIELK